MRFLGSSYICCTYRTGTSNNNTNDYLVNLKLCIVAGLRRIKGTYHTHDALHFGISYTVILIEKKLMPLENAWRCH
jgi:hypothetical protein